MQELIYLGFKVSTEGIQPSQENVERLLAAPLKTKADFQSFVGMAGFYRKWVPSYAMFVQPIYNYIKEPGVAKELFEEAAAVGSRRETQDCSLYLPFIIVPRLQCSFLPGDRW